MVGGCTFAFALPRLALTLHCVAFLKLVISLTLRLSSQRRNTAQRALLQSLIESPNAREPVHARRAPLRIFTH
jgi:hypothetical protein